MPDFTTRMRRRWQLMVTVAGPNDCWPWAGRLDDKGYGFIHVNGRTTRVHRVAWTLAHGDWPPVGQVVRHTCDNPPCCNPCHLILGSIRDNVHDCIDRGRRARGESLRQSKLTEVDVYNIRRRLSAGEYQRSVAADFHITQAAVSLIATGKTWRHVGDAA